MGVNKVLDKIKSSRGYNTIEMLLVMLLLCLFGVAIFSLIVTGTQTYDRINTTRVAQEDARTAISYVEIRLRQNDIEQQISMVENAVAGEKALKIHSPFVEGDVNTWIFFHEGSLYECITSGEALPTLDTSLPLVEVLSVDMSVEGNSVAIEVGYTANKVKRYMRTRVQLRTPQDGLGGAG